MTPSHNWTHRSRIDHILWDDPSFNSELTKKLKIDPNIDPSLRYSILHVIQDNWESFCEQGAPRPMFDFEFCIDTGDSKLVCCRRPVYDIHEWKIMNKHFQILENND